MTNNQIAKVELLDLTKVPEVAKSNRETADKITSACSKLLSTIKGIPTDEQFEQLIAYQKRVKDRFKELSDSRMPLTRKLDEVKKYFTEIEAEIKKVDGYLEVPIRAYKTQLARKEAEAEKAREALRKAKESQDHAERERIAKAKGAIDMHYNSEFNRWKGLATEEAVELFRLSRMEVSKEFLEYETTIYLKFNQEIQITKAGRIKAIRAGKDTTKSLEAQQQRIEQEAQAKAVELAERESLTKLPDLFDQVSTSPVGPDVKIKKELHPEVISLDGMLHMIVKYYFDNKNDIDLQKELKKHSYAINHAKSIANKNGELLKHNDIKYKEVIK